MTNNDKARDKYYTVILFVSLMLLAFLAGVVSQRIQNGEPLRPENQSELAPLTQAEKDALAFDSSHNDQMREEAQQRTEQHQRCAQWVATQDRIPPEKPLMETCREFKEKDPAGFVALFGYAPAPNPCAEYYVQNGVKTCVAAEEW